MCNELVIKSFMGIIMNNRLVEYTEMSNLINQQLVSVSLSVSLPVVCLSGCGVYVCLWCVCLSVVCLSVCGVSACLPACLPACLRVRARARARVCVCVCVCVNCKRFLIARAQNRVEQLIRYLLENVC